MTTLIAVYNSSGCVGRCDARCHDAEDDECTCICGGLNHGVGQQRAVENTRALAEAWLDKAKEAQAIERFKRENELHGKLRIKAQLALPL